MELYEIVKNVFDTSIQFLLSKEFQRAILFYFGWILLHYICSNLYVYICTPLTFMGFVFSPFYASAPQCIGLRWVINEAGNIIYHMWYAIGGWIALRIITNKRD